MTIPLPKIPSAEIPLPYQGEGHPPFASIPAGTFPAARRWRVMFRGEGKLAASLLIPSVAHYFSEGVLDTPTRVINRSLFDSEGILRLPALASHSPAYTSEGTLSVDAVQRTTYNFESEGLLDAETKVSGVAGFNSDSILDLTPVSIAKAEFSGGSRLVFGGGASPATEFSGGGTLTSESGIGAGANFSGAGEITTTQLTNIDAKWMSVGTLGAGAYEIEILMEPNFTSEGVVSAKPQPKDSSAGGGEGTLGAATQAKSPAALQGGGSLAVPAFVRYMRTAAYSGAGALAAAVEILGFDRQRMNKSGNFSVPNTSSYVTVTNWTSDSTYPSTVSNHQLLITGDGGATITASLDCTSGINGPGNAEFRMLRNGVEIASRGFSDSLAGNITMTWTGVLISGDLIRIEAKRGLNQSRDVLPSSYVEVRPG